MPKTIPVPPSDEMPRGPQPTPEVPDPAEPVTPPATGKGDRKNPKDPSQDPSLDPALLPIGDPAGMA
jgi:hypothetical protein